MLRFMIGLLTMTLFVHNTLRSEIQGKVDVGPALIYIDVLESGKTVDTMHMTGVKADATICVWRGVFVKPNLVWAKGDGELALGSIGIGHFLPINDCFLLMPSVGYSASHLKTTIDLDIDTEFGSITISDIKEKFRSSSAYIALEFTYKITEKWILMGMAQYAWSKTHTTLKSQDSLIDFSHSDKTHCQGPNYALGLEYCITPKWSVTLGGAYNISLSKEKHGLRAKGAKLGVAYYF